MTLHVKEKPEEAPAPAAFTLNAQSSSFASRSNDIFANLGTLEKKHSAFVKSQESSHDSDLEKDDPCENDGGDSSRFEYNSRALCSSSSREKSFRSRSRLGDTRDQDVESRSRNSSNDRGSGSRDGFRAPNRPPPRSKGVPDFKKHPERWTCYSLDDVPNSDMSDRSTKNAALEFLEERRKDRERQERMDAGLPEEEEKFDVNSGACSQGTIVFKRKQKPKEGDEISNEVKSSACNADSKLNSGGHSKEGTKNLSNVCEDPDNDGKGEIETIDEKTVKNSDNTEVFKFKAKKTVKRSIRKKDNNSDSDD